jgi:hypothetical protein
LYLNQGEVRGSLQEMLRDPSEKYKAFLECVLHMGEAGHFAGDREIKAMSAVLQRPILIMQPSKPRRGEASYAEKLLCKHFVPAALPELQDVARQHASLVERGKSGVVQPFELLEWHEVTRTAVWP